MALKDFILMVNSQAVVVEPPPEQEADVSVTHTYKSVSNKYVDVTFSRGVYRDSGGVNPVTTDNFSIVDATYSGVTLVEIASVKRNSHYTDGSALALIGGELTVRLFLTLTGTPDSTETFRVLCSGIYTSSSLIPVDINSGQVKLNATPLTLWDYSETASVTTTGLGISTLAGIMGVANFTQTTDLNRPLDGTDNITFNSATPKHMTGGDVGAMDFQKGNSFTIVIKRLSAFTNHTGFIISNRAAGTSRGWSVSVSSDGSLFFVMHDGTLQGFCDYDAFGASGEHTLFFVNNNGTLNIYDDAGNTLGTTGNATGIGTISYTGLSLLLGRRLTDTNAYFNGSFEKIAIWTGAKTLTERNAIIGNL